MEQTERFPRLFTLEEANAVLPRIRPLVDDLLQTFGEIRAEIETAATQADLPPGSPDLAKHLEARAIAPPLFDRVKTILERIQDQGCIVNGPEAGLVDFPCLLNSEIVFLCWKPGESRIAHWHRIPDGFAGRKPLLDSSTPEAGAGVH